MKKIVLASILALSISCTTYAQKTIKGNNTVGTELRKTESYDKITLIGSPDVELVTGLEGNITIKAETNLIPYIETYVKGDHLFIHFKEGYSYQTRKGVKIIVPIQDLSKISLKGSGDITGNHIFTDKNLDVGIEGSGDISINVENENLNVDVFGSGDLKIKGKTNRFNANVKGSGDIKAKDLKSNSSKLKVNGSGDIESTTTSNVSADVFGSGDIKIYGNPPKVEKSVNGSGEVKLK